MILALFLLMSCGGAGKNDQKVEQKDTLTVLDERVTLADPFIMLYQGTYYAYGTNADDGIEVYVSDVIEEKLKENVVFSFWEKADETHTVVRFVTSWATQKAEIEALRHLDLS